MVYQYEHLMSLICGLAPDRQLELEPETVWPRPIEEYETVSSAKHLLT